MQHAHVIVIGDALIDELRDETGVREFVGGAALNVAVGLAVLGISTTLVAMVGDDTDGGRIREFLAEHGVTLLATGGAHGSSRATSDRRAGEPTYVFNDAARGRRIEFDDDARQAIAGARHVVISSFPFDDQAQFDALVAAIGNPQNRLILDPNPRAGMMHDSALFAGNFERLAATSLLTKVSDEDAALLGYESLAALADSVRELGSEYVLTTAGSAGASIVSRSGMRVDVPITRLPGPIVDTMGAGDATLATICASLTSGGIPVGAPEWAQTLGDAMLVAAATCRAPGALIQLPQERRAAR